MKNILRIITSLSLTALLTGCPGKSSNNPIVPNNNWGCVNCGLNNSIQAQFGTPMTSQISQATLNLAFTGDAQQINYWASQGQNPIFTYQGQVGVTATLQVSQEIYMGACRLAVGTYQMQLIQPGTYNMGVFQFPYVQLVGPTSMTASIVDGVILTDGLGNIRSFSGLLLAQAGVPAFPQMGMPMPMGHTQIPCGDSVGARF